MSDLSQPVAELVSVLASMPDTTAVVLGGSHALGAADAASDWDLGVYYRSVIDLTALRDYGAVFPPGAWGRLMNGGAWLRCGLERVDVILRDVDVVEHWTRRAEQGEFEVDLLLGYLAGMPTYTLTAELASCRVLHGHIPAVPYPAMLSNAAPPSWRFRRSFSLDYARMHAKRGNVVGASGQAAKAVMEEAHALLCERGRWVCNEKRLVEAAGLTRVLASFREIPSEPERLVSWVDRVAAALGVPEDEVKPWNPPAGPASPSSRVRRRRVAARHR
jgi:hypothetical protein